MIPPSHTSARFTKGDELFDAWAKRFDDEASSSLPAVEVFVEVGGGTGAALFVYDGKQYWSPTYDPQAQEQQFIDTYDCDHGHLPDWSKEEVSDEAMNYEFDSALWAEDMLELDDIEWRNYDTEVPRVF